MEKTPTIIINMDGIVQSSTDVACAIAGLSRGALLDRPLQDHILPQHQQRFEAELVAFRTAQQTRSRLKTTLLGIDDVARALSMNISIASADTLSLELSAEFSDGIMAYPNTATIADAARLLAISRRVAAVCRKAPNKKELLSNAMAVMSEVTGATCSAAIEWGGAVADWPVAATTGTFDKEFLKGVFRSSVIGRLARGDVIVKDVLQDGTQSNHSLVLIPLMASETPEGIVILYVQGHSVMAPREQQSLGLLGEIIGLGIRSLAAVDESIEDSQTRAADVEATIALGRLSAGLAHEINNAVTVLRNNTEEISANMGHFSQNAGKELIIKDSIRAVEVIRDLTDALRAFAPEESRETENVDLLRVIDMVVSAVRFYAKRGINVNVGPVAEEVLHVKCRSHFLIRSLFLIFVELVESALASGRVLMVNITYLPQKKNIDFTISVSAGPFNVPTVLLSQLEKDGVLARLVNRAGATLSYEVKEEKLSLTLSLPMAKPTPTRIPAPPTRVHTRPERRGTILIVDDEPAIIRSTRRILEKDHDILAAGTAEEALDIMRANQHIDILLLDVFMPGMSGLELAETLKRMSSPLAQRIIFMTGGASNVEITKFMNESNAPMLEKPIDIPLLNALISDMITIY
ncbi:MAG: response regulator [Deltaproteobacteria bacterium]|nr:response regulator [Deltaproteobacteria bacterium]MBN2674565.1 response regulator [Deltaproteobacteria bacterium]